MFLTVIAGDLIGLKPKYQKRVPFSFSEVGASQNSRYLNLLYNSSVHIGMHCCKFDNTEIYNNYLENHFSISGVYDTVAHFIYY